MPSSLNSATRAPRLKELPTRSSWRRTKRLCAMLLFVLMLGGLIAAVAGCASPAPMPCEPLPPISKPVPDRSLPTVSYSQKASQLFEKWQAMLTPGQSKQ